MENLLTTITNVFAGTRNSGGRYATVETEELRLPLKCGWRRETTVREYSKSGVRGDVCYYAPCGKKFKQYPDIVRVRATKMTWHKHQYLYSSILFQFLEKSGVRNLQREHFSFSTKIFIGEFLKPTGMMSDNGEEKYVTLNENEMIADVDKIRKENGWKPRIRTSGGPAPPAGAPAPAAASPSSAPAAQGNSKANTNKTGKENK